MLHFGKYKIYSHARRNMEASDVIKKIENNYPIDEDVLSF